MPESGTLNMTNEHVYKIAPSAKKRGLTRSVSGRDQHGLEQRKKVVEERPLTIYPNKQEIVTAMTVGDYPDFLALGFLRNQGMLLADDQITGIDYDEEVEAVIVRTLRETDYEDKLKKKTRTSGCAVGTVYSDMMEGLEGMTLPQVEVRMGNNTMKVFGIAGWKNGGKATLMEGLVAEYCQRGFSVSTLKHAHHNVDVDQPGKDSYRHRQAGAREVVLASGNRPLLVLDDTNAAATASRNMPQELAVPVQKKRDIPAIADFISDHIGLGQ